MYQNASVTPLPSDKVVYVGKPPQTVPCFPLIPLNYLYCISETKQINGKWHVRLTGYSFYIHGKDNCWVPSTDFRLVGGSSLNDYSTR